MTAVLPDANQFSIQTVRSDATRAVLRTDGLLDQRNAAVLSGEIDRHLLLGHRFVRLDIRDLRIDEPEALLPLGREHERFLARRGTLVITGAHENFVTMAKAAGLGATLFYVQPTDLQHSTN